jgi:hypothetical protein
MAEYDAHAADYDLWAADMVDDVQWYASLAREAAKKGETRNVPAENRIEILREKGVISLGRKQT